MFSIWEPIGDAASAVACAALIYLFFRRRRKIGHKLFPRQLLMLALADMLYSIADFIFSLGAHPSLFSCQFMFSIMWSMNYVSCLLETHIAFGLMCAYWRQLRALRVLNRILILSWPIGIALGVAQTLMAVGVNPSGKFHHECGEVKNREAAYLMEVVITLVCFVASLVSYGASVVRVVRFPESVQHTVWRMAWAYPCTFFVTWGPLIVYQLFRNELNVKTGVGWVRFAISIKSLNGFLNVIVYALSSHFAKGRWAAEDVGRLALAAVGENGGVKEGESSDEDGTTPLRDFIDFHVGFRETDSIVAASTSRGTTHSGSTMLSEHSGGSGGQAPLR